MSYFRKFQYISNKNLKGIIISVQLATRTCFFSTKYNVTFAPGTVC